MVLFPFFLWAAAREMFGSWRPSPTGQLVDLLLQLLNLVLKNGYWIGDIKADNQISFYKHRQMIRGQERRRSKLRAGSYSIVIPGRVGTNVHGRNVLGTDFVSF